jgi:hypothetical protein
LREKGKISDLQKPQEDVQYIGTNDLVICYGMFRAPVHLFQQPGTTLIFVRVNMEPRLDQLNRAITFSFDNELERIAEIHRSSYLGETKRNF